MTSSVGPRHQQQLLHLQMQPQQLQPQQQQPQQQQQQQGHSRSHSPRTDRHASKHALGYALKRSVSYATMRSPEQSLQHQLGDEEERKLEIPVNRHVTLQHQLANSPFRSVAPHWLCLILACIKVLLQHLPSKQLVSTKSECLPSVT